MPFVTGSTPFNTFDSDVDFQTDADKLVTWVRLKLGSPVLETHLSSSEIYASFEESCFEYSALVNQYQAKSVLSQFLGTSSSVLSGSEQSFSSRLIEFQKKMAEPYGEEAFLNGPHTVYRGLITLKNGIQQYDLQALLSGTGALTGSNVNARIVVKKLYYFDPLATNLFFGSTSVLGYLNAEFNFESYTPQTVFYLLPVWEDILRRQEFKVSNKVRRSNYGYEFHNNILTIYPQPTADVNLFIDYMLVNQPDFQPDKVVNLANIPFGNITYSKVNAMGKQWIRRFAFELSKEIEGLIRSKMGTIPIPGGELTMNGPALVQDSKTEQDRLRNELKEILDETTYDKIMAREAQMVEDNKKTLMEVPLGLFCF